MTIHHGLTPHELIASDSYWAEPIAPTQERVSPAAQVVDLLGAQGTLQSIDDTYRAIAERGMAVSPIAQGEQLDYVGGRELLKIVEDLRVHPRKRIRGFKDPLEEFDAAADQMLQETLYRGDSAMTRVETATGNLAVARTVLYAQSSWSGRQLAAKSSKTLGRGVNNQYAASFFRQGVTVGEITSDESRKGLVERKIVSAELIIPAGPKKARRVIDLSAVRNALSPKIVPQAV